MLRIFSRSLVAGLAPCSLSSSFATIRTKQEFRHVFWVTVVAEPRRLGNHEWLHPCVANAPRRAVRPNPSFEARPNGKPPAPGRWYMVIIFTGPGLASCRRSRLNSNVRPREKCHSMSLVGLFSQSRAY